ncbi:MAG: alpha/beta fold hydrolase [Acidimicrobiia bacterium]
MRVAEGYRSGIPVSRYLDLQVPVHYADFGGSGAALVLIHGLGGSHTNWLAVGETLAGRGRVAAIDLPGFGLTPPVGPLFTLESHRQVLEGFLERLAAGPVTLVGNSMGGLLALLHATRRPHQVARLLLVCPAVPLPPGHRHVDPRVAGRLALRGLPLVGPAYLRWYAASHSPADQVRDTLRLVCADPARVPPQVVTAGIRLVATRAKQPWAARAVARSGRATAARLVRRRRFDDLVAGVPCPALVIAGTADRLVVAEGLRRMASIRPDWELVEMEGVGHCPMMETPRWFLDVVEDWLERHGG